MLLFRPVRKNDLSAVFALAKLAGSGMTTLPTDRGVLSKRIQHSLQAFATDVRAPQQENYLFVLQDLANKRIAGITGINAIVGNGVPFYSYKLSKITRFCQQLQIRNEYKMLRLVNDYQGNTEVCSLFLHPDYRSYGNGYFLSRARFLFISQFKQRFSKLIIAEMRGISDENGRSPFWESVGKHFFLMSYQQADHLTTTTNKQFIADLMPRHPIYIALLNKRTQHVIGKPHKLTRRALRILQAEGFSYRGYVDIFDGGPTFEAARDQIRTVQARNIAMLTDVAARLDGEQYLLSNTKLDFRACVGQLHIDQGKYIIDKRVAKALAIKRGDSFQYAPF